ncbi:type II and III secretion system protein family protein [Solimonas variicoloris]|uniref:type II and III secretion system protein family protein n=1 Tax=Solimonas variicoloris TaxID=254408 RepID=UPI0003A337C5|nr:type II and III secretion system protein family protein [Solimonas variicoloris]
MNNKQALRTMNSRFGFVLLQVLLLLGAWLGSVPSRADDTVPGAVVIVEQGTHKLMRANADVTRVAVGNPATADVSVVNRRDLLLNGKAVGITSLMIWVKGSTQPRQYIVRVQLPTDPLKANVQDPELGNAVVDPGRGVEGKLPNLLAHRRAQLGASAQKEGAITDRSSIELESQVLTEVKIAEVSRTTAQQYGLGLGYSGKRHNGSEWSFDAPQTSSSALENAFNLVFTRTFDNGKQEIKSTLNLLESKGLAHVLAEPSLLATSGQTASYLAGGEFPVPVSQGGGGSATNSAITVQYKEFGVRLSLTPTVLARDRIALKVAPEVSDLDFSAGITVAGVSVPALKVRRTDTSIELGDGETFIISGLVSSNLTDNVDKFPWLGDIPVLGAFFKSTTLDRTDKELIMVVTPHLVRPVAKGVALPKLPGDQFNGKTPNPAYSIFFERGEFDSGFSR